MGDRLFKESFSIVWNGNRFFFMLLLLFFFGSCVSLKSVPTPLNLSEQQWTALVAQMALEQQKVDSFFVNGTLDIKNQKGDAEVAILSVGIRNPLRLKIEVSQSWGTPILHILIDQNRMEVLSFTEQTYYSGTFQSQWMSRFLGVELSPEMIWASLRGYPLILLQNAGRREGPNPVTLKDQDDRLIEQITINPETLMPAEVFFPQSKLYLRFSEYQQSNQVLYAQKIEISRSDQKQVLFLSYTEALFNLEVPSQIFSLSKPAGFKTVELDEQSFDSQR
jgi:hypothetical protein